MTGAGERDPGTVADDPGTRRTSAGNQTQDVGDAQ